MKKLLFVTLACAAMLAPAAAQTPYVWVRLDGQRASTNAALLLEFQLAKADCAHGATVVSEMTIRCMRMRGYRWTPLPPASRLVVRARG